MHTLPRPGEIVLLTTRSEDGLRTRPVTVAEASNPGSLTVLTAPGARKVIELSAHPQLTVAAPTPSGWWSAEGVARIETDPGQVRAILTGLGAPADVPAVALRISLHHARTWVVHSPAPFDNTMTDHELTDTAIQEPQ